MSATRDLWRLSLRFDGSAYRGRLIEAGEYAAVIDVDHLHDDWTAEEYESRRATDWESVWKYDTLEEVQAAAIRQWCKIGYLDWTGAILTIDGQVIAEVARRS